MKFSQKRPVGRPRTHLKDSASPALLNAARCRAYRQHKKEAARQRKLWDPTHETPQDLFDTLHAHFHFTLDVCAVSSNAKCPRYFTPEEDGLAQDWGREICWMNPPYARGRVSDRWVHKAYESAKAGATVVCLLLASTDSQRFQRYVKPLPPGDYGFLPKRLKFGGARHNAPFACMLVVFWPIPPRPDLVIDIEILISEWMQGGKTKREGEA
jgi:DNA N-6-adenine-methyltransferase (Dam)